MVILLNILIALYNSAYEDITDNSDDEYLALFAQKTMQFVRAPDENVFIAPFNLVEIFLLIMETRSAHRVKSNKKRGAEEDDTIEEWEQLEGECDFEADGWAKKVEQTKPNVETDSATRECMELRKEINVLKKMIETLVKDKDVGGDLITWNYSSSLFLFTE